MKIEVMYHANYNGWSIWIDGQSYEGPLMDKLTDVTNDPKIVDDDGEMCCDESDVVELVQPLLDEWSATLGQKVNIQIEFDYVSS